MQHISAYKGEVFFLFFCAHTREILTEAEVKLKWVEWRMTRNEAREQKRERENVEKEFFVFVNKTNSFEKKWKAECTH